MSIHAKIEEIRRKPEHIRMRYVVTSVAVSMFFISVLWIFSITTSFQNQKTNKPLPAEPSSQMNPNTSQPDGAPSLNEWIKK